MTDGRSYEQKSAHPKAPPPGKGGNGGATSQPMAPPAGPTPTPSRPSR